MSAPGANVTVTERRARATRPMLPLVGLVMLLLAVVGTGCLPKARPITPPANPRPLVPPQHVQGKGSLYFAPLNDFSVDTVHELAAYYKKKLGIDIRVLPRLALPASARAQNGTYADVKVFQAMGTNFDWANVLANRQSQIIGFLRQGVYAEETGQQYIFQASRTTGMGLISTARMDPAFSGAPRDPVRLQTRLRKTTTKLIGVMYYDLERSDDPASVMYYPVLEPEDLDVIGEGF